MKKGISYSCVKTFFSETLFWGVILLICFGVISWIGGTGAFLVQGEFLKSVLLFVFGPIIAIFAVVCCVYFNSTSNWY